jgi:ligand-binding sensor domain-containing protein
MPYLLRLSPIRFVLCCLFILFARNLSAQQGLINAGPLVENIERVSGESLKGVWDIHQSRSGFIWLASDNGIMRYDGHTVKRFLHKENDPHSLPHNDVRKIVEDEQGFLWLATYGGGLSRFNPKTEHFDNFATSPNDNTTLNHNKLRSINLGSDNILWIGSIVGVNRFDRKTLKNTRLNARLQPFDPDKPQKINQIFQDSQQRVWVSATRKGLYLHDKWVENIA